MNGFKCNNNIVRKFFKCIQNLKTTKPFLHKIYVLLRAPMEDSAQSKLGLEYQKKIQFDTNETFCTGCLKVPLRL